MAKIAVIGTGYVGLVSGAIFSDFGHIVICVDIDQIKIDQLCEGTIPIYEPGLEQIVKNNVDVKRLSFTTDMKDAIDNSDIIFIAVGTPIRDDASVDVQSVLNAASDIARHMKSYKTIVIKSTVPVGTGQQVKTVLQEVLSSRHLDIPFDVVSNPEFLREGSAVQDFLHPDRIVIGSESERTLQIMKDVYRLNEVPFVETSIETAEMIKYASNAFLAMKITFMNELANVCENVGANVQQVAQAMGMDKRISPLFLNPGPGIGGSCFPKDVRTLAQTARVHGNPMQLMEAVIKANERQKTKMVEKITHVLGRDLHGKTLAILGVTFKANTDDMREAPSLVILPELAKLGAALKVSDPQGKKEGSVRFKGIEKQLSWHNDIYEAIKHSDATIILTEWDQFKAIDFSQYESLNAKKVLFDLRNLYRKEKLEELGFIYHGVGV